MRRHLMLQGWLAHANAVWFLFILYLLPRLVMLFVHIEPFADAMWYFKRAVEMAAGQGYSEDGFPTAYWPPGWPLTLALIFKMFGPTVSVVTAFNLLCSIATGWLTLDLGRKLFNSELAGRTALLLLAIYPNHIGYIPLVMPEVFYTTLLLSALWLFVAGRQKLHLVGLGLILGVATLVKTQTAMILPFVFGIELFRKQITFRQLSTTFVRAVVALTFACIVIVPWTVRNRRVFGEWIFVSTNGGLTLLTGNNPAARGDYTPDDPLVTSIQQSVSNQVSVDTEARQRAIEWIRNNPGRFIQLLPLKWFRLWAPDGEAEWGFQGGYERYGEYTVYFRAVRYVNQAYYSVLLAGAAWAGVLLFSGRARTSESYFDFWMLPYSLALYTTLISLVFSGQSRYHYPIMPLIVMCTGWLLGSDVLLRQPTQSAKA